MLIDPGLVPWLSAAQHPLAGVYPSSCSESSSCPLFPGSWFHTLAPSSPVCQAARHDLRREGEQTKLQNTMTQLIKHHHTRSLTFSELLGLVSPLFHLILIDQPVQSEDHNEERCNDAERWTVSRIGSQTQSNWAKPGHLLLGCMSSPTCLLMNTRFVCDGIHLFAQLWLSCCWPHCPVN